MGNDQFGKNLLKSMSVKKFSYLGQFIRGLRTPGNMWKVQQLRLKTFLLLDFIEFERNIFEQSVSNIKLKNNSYSRTFLGYERKNGKVGTRNYIGLVSTVNCSATVVKLIANKINDYLNQNTFNNIDGAVCLKHSSGCGMNTDG